MTTTYKRSNAPSKWHGGKYYLAKRIIELMPPHLVYVEPYFGMGNVLLARDPDRDWLINENWKLKNGEKVPAHLRGCSEVVNDIDCGLTTFWAALRSPAIFNALLHRLSMTPFSKEEWLQAVASHMDFENFPKWYDEKKLEAAATFFIKYRQSRQGLGKDFATLTRNRTRCGMNEQVSSWLSAIEGLPEIHERLKRVVILNDDACKVIRQQDGENTLFYCDPPYLQSTRSSTGEYGEFEMSNKDHKRLLHLLMVIGGKFILSGYRSNLYDDYAYGNNWHRIDIEIDDKASSKKKKEKKTECLWMNYEPEAKR